MKTGSRFHAVKITASILIFALAGCASTGGIRPFTTDGCSLFPEGTLKHKDLWLSCCTQHDRSYWIGGTRDERLKADRDLKDCVAQAGAPDIAELMLAGVRAGGTPYLPTAFRWGYGWPYFRGYKALTKEELGMVKNLLEGK